MRVDELLEMSRKMAERLARLQKDQAGLLDRLSRGVSDMRGALEAAGDVVRVR